MSPAARCKCNQAPSGFGGLSDNLIKELTILFKACEQVVDY